ncbi:MAG: universal stress protein [Acidobacteria bacterium]|nr:universal stress protein [Acidobacteriota bacterium]
MFARILVPIDFSATTDAALEYARLFARTSDSTLHVLHVTGERLTPPHTAADAHAEPAALQQIRQRLTDDDRRHRLTIRLVERGAPGEAILAYARNADIDLIVMGTHGRTGVAHLIMGSVAETVVRGAPCPVFTVHGDSRGAPPFTRILVPTDFSGPSDTALDCARRLQLRFGASIHLLHVLEEEVTAGPLGAEVFVTESPEARAARLRSARERLSHRVSAADRESGRLTTEILFGPTANTIVDYAGDNGYDLIVMGTHGRTGLAHLLMGSVAERVIRSAACPVMTTHGGRTCEVAVPVGAATEAAVS